MYSESDLVAEVREIIRKNVEKGTTVPSPWVTQEVLSSHDKIYGEDTDFHRYCALEHVKDTVRAEVGRWKSTPQQKDKQMILAGFEYLQKAYCIERNNTPTIVPIEKMTHEEIQAKANEYERMAEGCRKHADELRRYEQIRKNRVA